MNIDDVRRNMILDGVPAQFAGIATGIAAEYALQIHNEAYDKGYNNGWNDRIKKEHTVY